LSSSQTQQSYRPQCIKTEQNAPTQAKEQTDPELNNSPAVTSQIKNLGSSSPTVQNSGDTTKMRSGQYPASFATYLDQKLKTNKPDSNNCIVSYSITRVSNVNIMGGVQTVDANTNRPSNSCGGGATVVWYLMSGNWYEIGLQAQPECSQLSKTTIYSEFVTTCFDPNAPNQESKNPNGSIAKAQ
jgi:hypothetical protein